MDSFIRAVKFLSRVTGVVGAFLVGAAVLVICDMVIERYIFNLTTIWQIASSARRSSRALTS
jgi:TRAP-type C4-dicarboxylate transport system permease small subunit